MWSLRPSRLAQSSRDWFPMAAGANRPGEPFGFRPRFWWSGLRRLEAPCDTGKRKESIETIGIPYDGSPAGPMNIRDLRYLIAVAEHQHFGHAAKACGVSQPTLSVQVRKLEELLGVVLFERTSKIIVPTAVCEGMIGHARAVVAQADAMLDVARNQRDPLAG